nr:galactosylgalactosylxylosylprotein 3-beta-glucuronosyltransferase 1-like [Nerophis lumbriciformis]
MTTRHSDRLLTQHSEHLPTQHSDRPPTKRDDVLPTIFFITPTYARPVQKADLTRLSNTLLHVRNLHWIVVEDSTQKTSLVSRFLNKTGLKYTHLTALSPTFKTITKGTLQRNAGLSWLRQTFDVKNHPPGVVYFGDDDNSYSLQLFEEMRWTKRVSVWPVAFVGGAWYETPKVNNLGKFNGWDVKYDPSRKFATDMAGFAINLDLILSKPKAFFNLNIAGGYEGTLLRDLVTREDLEPKAANCTQILVWHTRTSSPNSSGEKGIKYSDKKLEV